MAKLKLDLDRIDVQSFEVSEGDRPRGTILANASVLLGCDTSVAPNCPSRVAEVDCPQSYYGTCASCGNTCAGCSAACPTHTVECEETS